MSLTPKNWAEFQHYKDRSPIWIKLHRKLLDDYAFSRLPVASRALAPMLWLLASEYEGGVITATNDEIAFRFRTSAAEFNEALEPLISSEFFASDSKPLARRKRAAIPERERETETQVETEKETDIRTVAKATRTLVTEDFEKFWKAYPKRDGQNPKQLARKSFEKLVSSGTSAETVILAAGHFAADCRSRGEENTKFVAMASTWLNQRRDLDYSATDPPAGLISDDEKARLFAELRGTNGSQSGKENQDLRAARGGPCEVEGLGREEPTGHADDQAEDAGMGRVAQIFHGSPGLRTFADAPGDSGAEQGNVRPRLAARGL